MEATDCQLIDLDFSILQSIDKEINTLGSLALILESPFIFVSKGDY